MKSSVYFFYLFILPFFVIAQNPNFQHISNLGESNQETSGMVYYNNELYVINDSGNLSVIWVLNPANGQVQRVMKVHGITNNDWEAMAQDETHIYIGDFGNNDGTRTDLNILKISKSELQNDSVFPELITFSYPDQNSFTPQPQNTQFDAEALSVINGELFIFTKNWTQNNTSIYSVPTISGDYEATYIHTIATPGMITGSSYLNSEQKLVLVGYDEYLQNFMIQFENFTASCNFTSTHEVYNGLNEMSNPLQTESIALTSATHAYLATEHFETSIAGFTFQSAAALYETAIPDTPNLGGSEDKPYMDIKIYPNPATHYIMLSMKDKAAISQFQLIDVAGNQIPVKMNPDQSIEVSHLKSGVYTIIAYGKYKTYNAKFIKK